MAKPPSNGVFHVLETRLLVDRSPYARIYDQDVQIPGGDIIRNFVQVDLPSYVIMFAVLEDGRVPFVEQYRIGLSAVTLELPAGQINSSEEPLEAAQRELREETGAEGRDWKFLGKYVMDPNRQCGWGHVYMVQQARQVVAPNANDLGDMHVQLLTLDEVRRRLAEASFLTGSTVMAIGLALNALNS